MVVEVGCGHGTDEGEGKRPRPPLPPFIPGAVGHGGRGSSPLVSSRLDASADTSCMQCGEGEGEHWRALAGEQVSWSLQGSAICDIHLHICIWQPIALLLFWAAPQPVSHHYSRRHGVEGGKKICTASLESKWVDNQRPPIWPASGDVEGTDYNPSILP